MRQRPQGPVMGHQAKPSGPDSRHAGSAQQGGPRGFLGISHQRLRCCEAHDSVTRSKRPVQRTQAPGTLPPQQICPARYMRCWLC